MIRARPPPFVRLPSHSRLSLFEAFKPPHSDVGGTEVSCPGKLVRDVFRSGENVSVRQDFERIKKLPSGRYSLVRVTGSDFEVARAFRSAPQRIWAGSEIESFLIAEAGGDLSPLERKRVHSRVKAGLIALMRTRTVRVHEKGGYVWREGFWGDLAGVRYDLLLLSDSMGYELLVSKHGLPPGAHDPLEDPIECARRVEDSVRQLQVSLKLELQRLDKVRNEQWAKFGRPGALNVSHGVLSRNPPGSKYVLRGARRLAK